MIDLADLGVSAPNLSVGEEEVEHNGFVSQRQDCAMEKKDGETEKKKERERKKE